MFLCPFCMKHHRFSVHKCPDKGLRIPTVYVEDTKRGIPIVVMLTIGYSGHGKTCFLSSFFHTLYRGRVSEKWPGFSFIGLTMETLNRLHHEYVNILDHGRVPPKTPIMFPTPLILKFQQVPLKVKSLFKKYFKRITIAQDELICIFYDIGGGTFDVDEKIRHNIPILVEIDTLVFLISVPRLLQDMKTGISVVQQMHKLINTIVLVIEEIDQKKKKDLVICFTMGDEMWESQDLRYGQLAIPIYHPLPAPDDMSSYFTAFQDDSDIICQHMKESYPPFYNVLENNFRSFRFTTISALGSQPTREGKIEQLTPANIFDPFLSLLRSEGYL